MLAEEYTVREFTAFDRCDACGAQAYAIAESDDLGEFLFCVHHLKRHRDALLDSGFSIAEDTQAIEGLFSGPVAAY